MAMMGNVQELAARVAEQMKGKLAQYQNQDFRDACMGVCALVAMADGVLSDSERRKVIACIERTEALRHFSAASLRDIFTNFCELAKDDFTKVDVFKAVRKVAGNADQADMVVKIALIIAKSDGDFAAIEKDVICHIIAVLGLNENDYDLSAAAPATAPSKPAPQAAPALSAPTQPLPPLVVGSCLKQMSKGERLSLDQVAAAQLSRLRVGIGFGGNDSGSLTVAVQLYNKDKQLLKTVDWQNQSALDALVHHGNTRVTSALGDDQEVSVTLGALASHATSALFVVTNRSGTAINASSTTQIRIMEEAAPDRQLVRFAHSLQGKPVALIVGRLYLHSAQWKFQAIGEEVSSQPPEALQKLMATFA
jgi:tellurite resistance protein TerB